MDLEEGLQEGSNMDTSLTSSNTSSDTGHSEFSLTSSASSKTSSDTDHSEFSLTSRNTSSARSSDTDRSKFAEKFPPKSPSDSKANKSHMRDTGKRRNSDCSDSSGVSKKRPPSTNVNPVIPTITIQDIHVAEAPFRSELTNTFTIKDFVKRLSKPNNGLLTNLFYVRNLAWRLNLQHFFSPTRQVDSFGYYIKCSGDHDSPEWSCHAVVELRILPIGREIFSRRLEHNFSSVEDNAGFSNYLDWKDIQDPANKFIEDDTLRVQIYIAADVPKNVSFKIIDCTRSLSDVIIDPEERKPEPKMVHILPDEMLENLVCANCQKYLSVKPVMIQEGGQIICGRCTRYYEKGVISLFGIMADHCLFRCVNRFDGCQELLTYGEVEKHETVCKSREITCPLCEGTVIIPTYKIMKHFETNHKENVLEVPCFEINLCISFQISKLFLYKKKNSLFFITFGFGISLNGFILNTYLLGLPKEAKMHSQKYIVSGDNWEISTEEKACLAFDSMDEGGFTLPLTKSQKKPLINVKLQLNSAKSTEVVKIPHSLTIQPEQNTINELHHINNSVIENMRTGRNIFLSDNFLKSFKDLSVGLDLVSLRMETENGPVNIKLSCYNCNVVEYSVLSNDIDKIFLIKEQTYEPTYHLLCYLCHLYVTKKNIKLESNWDLLKASVAKQIQYFCSWKCGKYFSFSTVNAHEVFCEENPRKKNFRQYVKINRRNGWEVSHKSSIQVKMSIEKSPIKIHVCVSNTSVRLEFKWKQPHWEISISLEDENMTSFHPRALVFDSQNEFLALVKKQSTIYHREILKVKCYLTSSLNTSPWEEESSGPAGPKVALVEWDQHAFYTVGVSGV